MFRPAVNSKVTLLENINNSAAIGRKTMIIVSNNVKVEMFTKASGKLQQFFVSYFRLRYAMTLNNDMLY